MSSDARNGTPADRRPLASRGTRWAQKCAIVLGNTAITPNQISYGSLLAAGISLLALLLSVNMAGWGQAWCYVIAALFCQLRLFCNLMDGMVAIEAGKQTPDGAFWNELPDRFADMAIFAGVGFAAGWSSLGWAAAALAVSVAYVRELGKGIDGYVDFAGPMAKPQRMALVSVALILAAMAGWLPFGWSGTLVAAQILQWCLWIVIAGCVITLWRRSRSLLRRLQP